MILLLIFSAVNIVVGLHVNRRRRSLRAGRDGNCCCCASEYILCAADKGYSVLRTSARTRTRYLPYSIAITIINTVVIIVSRVQKSETRERNTISLLSQRTNVHTISADIARTHVRLHNSIVHARTHKSGAIAVWSSRPYWYTVCVRPSACVCVRV